MTSNINANNIDGQYPVAGQDNDSQGFRDNFTATKTNFQYASAEITDLQNKAVLKAALTGTTLNNDMNGATLSNAVLQDMAGNVVALVSGNSVAVDYTQGPYQTLTLNSATSLSFVGGSFPPSGQSGSMIVRFNVTAANVALTLPGQVGNGNSITSVSGIQGYSGNVITFAEAGTYEFQFDTTDNGSSIYLSELTRPRNRWTNPLFLDVTQTIAANGNVSLATTTSLFTSNADPILSNLATGSAGQIKILAYGNGSSDGNCLVTVSNAAWGGSNIANVSVIGSACTLQYINSKWYCIGNNGVVFS